MKRTIPFEIIYQTIALLVAIVFVHLIYVTVIRPNADAILTVQAEKSARGEAFVQDRSIYVIVRDYEQESCFILMLWAMAIMDDIIGPSIVGRNNRQAGSGGF